MDNKIKLISNPASNINNNKQQHLPQKNINITHNAKKAFRDLLEDLILEQREQMKLYNYQFIIQERVK